jgi:hypothetical protein
MEQKFTLTKEQKDILIKCNNQVINAKKELGDSQANFDTAITLITGEIHIGIIKIEGDELILIKEEKNNGTPS